MPILPRRKLPWNRGTSATGAAMGEHAGTKQRPRHPKQGKKHAVWGADSESDCQGLQMSPVWAEAGREPWSELGAKLQGGTCWCPQSLQPRNSRLSSPFPWPLFPHWKHKGMRSFALWMSLQPLKTIISFSHLPHKTRGHNAQESL